MTREFDNMVDYMRLLKVTPINNETSNQGDLYEVHNYYVRVFKKKGRRLITCNCENGTRNPKESTICVHKLAVIRYLLLNEKQRQAKEIEEEIKRFKDLNLEITNAMYEDYVKILLKIILR